MATPRGQNVGLQEEKTKSVLDSVHLWLNVELHEEFSLSTPPLYAANIF